MPKGYIKTVHEKAYGFVRIENTDYFFHKNDFNGFWTDLVNDFYELEINEKIEVEFEIGNSPKGPCALNVRRLDWPNEGTG